MARGRGRQSSVISIPLALSKNSFLHTDPQGLFLKREEKKLTPRFGSRSMIGIVITVVHVRDW